MNTAAIKDVAEREPFRPFVLRLSNGREYRFTQPREFGAAKNYGTVVFFGDERLVLIDRESIAEIITE